MPKPLKPTEIATQIVSNMNLKNINLFLKYLQKKRLQLEPVKKY
jgi:hypothetical protein